MNMKLKWKKKKNFKMKKKFAKMLNNKGHSIEPCGMLKTISNQEL